MHKKYNCNYLILLKNRVDFLEFQAFSENISAI